MTKDRQPQVEKFKRVARELEADESEEAFDRALKKVAKVQRDQSGSKQKHRKTD